MYELFMSEAIKMNKERKIELLSLCAENILKCKPPLYFDFLIENKISYEEEDELRKIMNKALKDYTNFIEK